MSFFQARSSLHPRLGGIREQARLFLDQKTYGFSAVERKIEIDDSGETETVRYSNPTMLQPGLTLTRPMDDRPGYGIIPRHVQRMIEITGLPKDTLIEQRFSPLLRRWCIDVELPGHDPVRIWSRPELRGGGPSNWGGIYDLQALAQLAMRYHATERGGYC